MLKGTYNLSDLRLFEIFGDGLAARDFSLKSDINSGIQDLDLDEMGISPLVSTVNNSKFDVHKVVASSLNNRKHQIAFLTGYAERLAKDNYVEEAINFALIYKDFKNERCVDEDVFKVFRAIFEITHPDKRDFWEEKKWYEDLIKTGKS